MLRRALRSLVDQSEGRWRAIVFDDSPSSEAHPIVKDFSDGRIEYRQNPKNLGAAKNLDQAFRTNAYLDAKYAFVLEDDNSIEPNFIEANIERLLKDKCQLMIRNQAIGIDTGGNSYQLTGSTTRGHIFEDGIVHPLNLRASLFFCEGISNGGLFWRTDANTKLSVGREVQSAALQEHIRTLQVASPISFASEPLATFSLPPGGTTTREPLENRKYARARQAILRRLFEQHGPCLVEAAYNLVRNKSMERRLRKELADIFILPYVFFDLRQSMKGLARITLFDDPLSKYWYSKKENSEPR